MPRLHPVVAALGVTIAATAVVATGPSSASAAPPLPPTATYTVTTGATGPNQYSTDSPASPFVDKDGTFYTQQSAALYNANDPRYWAFFTGTDFDDAKRSAAISDAVNPNNPLDRNNDTTWRCNNSPTGKIASYPPPPTTWQKNYCDLIGTWVDPDTGDWIGLVHNEFTMAPHGDGMHYDSIDYAVSTDQGKTWDIKDHVITSPYSTVRRDNVAFPNQTYYMGGGDQRLFADPASGYFYVYYGTQILNKGFPPGTWNMRHERVARAPMSGKLAPGTWQKWYNGAWTEPGIGGKESNIVPVTTSNPNGYTPAAEEYDPLNTGTVAEQIAAGKIPGQSPLLYMSVTYNAYLGLYMGTANPVNTDASPKSPMPIYVTDDLATQKWYKIGDTGDVKYADYWYHWLVDPVGKIGGTVTGRTYREYCDFGCPSGGSEWRNITVDSTTPATPVSPSLAYQITSSSGRTLAQVPGSTATTSVASPTGSASEKWSFQPTGDGAYSIVNVASGQALGVDSATTTSRAWGTKLTVVPSDSTAGQQWFIVKNVSPAGSYRLVNRHSGLVLGMSSDADRLAETTPTRSWTDETGNAVGGNRTAGEQTVAFRAAGQSTNLALNKPATAQNERPGHAASRAVDSNARTFWGAGGALPQWWQVDLQGVYQLSNVTVVNDHRPKRSYRYDVQVSIDGTKWTTVATKDNANPATETGDSHRLSATARYVRINLTGSSERDGGRLEDVIVNGVPALNLALKKPATAQSSGAEHAAELAVDSDPGSSWAADGPLPQWWQVDLRDVYQLSNVTVVNPPGGNRSYQYDVQVSTDGTTWTTVATKDNANPATETGDLHPLTTTARYVRVNMTGASAGSNGHLATVVVNGTPAVNLALNKPATAQSSEAGHPAGMAVDADAGSYWATWPLPGWWQVDLQDVYRLSNVTVTNYYADGRYYKYDVQVSTDGTTWTTVGTKNTTTPATSAGDSYPLATTARYVRVNVTANSANPSGHITNVVVNGTKP
ncbi:discoidin domain-containing protein [Streptosporangium sp. NPDC020072]|uniref:galactose-binding domain-containing protein n=1 Tax=Streptosporangium sp. NPDC020072 TaxID=3154788 RepID=UPI0034495E73